MGLRDSGGIAVDRSGGCLCGEGSHGCDVLTCQDMDMLIVTSAAVITVGQNKGGAENGNSDNRLENHFVDNPAGIEESLLLVDCVLFRWLIKLFLKVPNKA